MSEVTTSEVTMPEEKFPFSSGIARFKSISMGVFNDPQIRNVKGFDFFNVIYGQNYSGKTTLSKIVRALETKQIPEGYSPCEFEITIKTGEGEQEEKINHKNFSEFQFPINVFNPDFIRDNIGFLVNEAAGGITSFVLGEENVEVQQKIQKLEAELGSKNSNDGKQYSVMKKAEGQETSASESRVNAETDHKNIKSDIARAIHKNEDARLDTYNRLHFEKDEGTIGENPNNFRLDQTRVEKLKEIVWQEAQPEIPPHALHASIEQAQITFQASKECIERKVEIAHPISELTKHPKLENWVSSGLELHTERSTCAFCSNEIKSERRDELSGHFTKEVIDLQSQIDKMLNEVETLKEELKQTRTPRVEQFYPALKSDAESVLDGFKTAGETLRRSAGMVAGLLRQRKSSISQPGDGSDVVSENHIPQATIALNTLIAKNNKHTGDVEEESTRAKNAYRMHLVSEAMVEKEYIGRQHEISRLKNVEKKSKEDAITATKAVKRTQTQIKDLRAQMRSEEIAADRINGLLKEYFKADSFRINVAPNDKKKFILARASDNNPAKNLSEGEKTMLAFCYFVARFNILSDDSTAEKPIIWIDDPVSSLDSNHLYGIAAMMMEQFKLPKKKDGNDERNCRQLFITTHSIEFLNFISKGNRWYSRGKHKFFHVERKHSEYAQISNMPDWLKSYPTTYVLLFKHIYECASEENVDQYELVTLGNVIRRFLETHLYLKFPQNNFDENKALDLFVGEADFVNAKELRLFMNTQSHKAEAVSTDGSKGENKAKEIAKEICYLMEKNDSSQYDNLVKTVKGLT